MLVSLNVKGHKRQWKEKLNRFVGLIISMINVIKIFFLKLIIHVTGCCAVGFHIGANLKAK